MKVLFATDGSAASEEAEWFLCRVPFPEPIELTLTTVTVAPLLEAVPAAIHEMVREEHQRAGHLLEQEAARFEGINGTVSTTVLSGHPAQEIVRFAEQNHTDLIVVGARGTTPTQRFLLGSVSEKVARHAPCSVLVTVLEQSQLGFAASTRNQGWLHSGAWFAPRHPELARQGCCESPTSPGPARRRPSRLGRSRFER